VGSVSPKLLIAAALVTAIGLLVDLATDRRWLDVILSLLVGALLVGSYALHAWARRELMYKPAAATETDDARP
jgi:sugar phosphate permease